MVNRESLEDNKDQLKTTESHRKTAEGHLDRLRELLLCVTSGVQIKISFCSSAKICSVTRKHLHVYVSVHNMPQALVQVRDLSINWYPEICVLPDHC